MCKLHVYFCRILRSHHRTPLRSHQRKIRQSSPSTQRHPNEIILRTQETHRRSTQTVLTGHIKTHHHGMRRELGRNRLNFIPGIHRRKRKNTKRHHQIRITTLHHHRITQSNITGTRSHGNPHRSKTTHAIPSSMPGSYHQNGPQVTHHHPQLLHQLRKYTNGSCIFPHLLTSLQMETLSFTRSRHSHHRSTQPSSQTIPELIHRPPSQISGPQTRQHYDATRMEEQTRPRINNTGPPQGNERPNHLRRKKQQQRQGKTPQSTHQRSHHHVRRTLNRQGPFCHSTGRRPHHHQKKHRRRKDQEEPQHKQHRRTQTQMASTRQQIPQH